MNVSLFITCLSDFFYPNVGKSLVAVLERMGVSVDFPQRQTCCGQPAFNTGYVNGTRPAAEHLIATFDKSEYVVAPSGSCVSMVRHHYPTLFKDDAARKERAERFSRKLYEFSEFMIHVLKVTELDAAFDGVATYHHSCHMMRGLGVRDEPLTLLRSVRGLTMSELPYAHDCCGFGGTFAVKMHTISEKMVAEKAEHIRSTGADILVGSDMACLMNIGGYMKRQRIPIRIYHVAELLDEGMRRHENE
jgi:L-lactate dehydrogenase complex protein LldE